MVFKGDQALHIILKQFLGRMAKTKILVLLSVEKHYPFSTPTSMSMGPFCTRFYSKIRCMHE